MVRGSGERCAPGVLVNGGRVRAGIADSTLRALVMSELFGVEVYRDPSEVPREFASVAGECGVVAVWRR
jgi:hypothetical protein